MKKIVLLQDETFRSWRNFAVLQKSLRYLEQERTERIMKNSFIALKQNIEKRRAKLKLKNSAAKVYERFALRRCFGEFKEIHRRYTDDNWLTVKTNMKQVQQRYDTKLRVKCMAAWLIWTQQYRRIIRNMKLKASVFYSTNVLHLAITQWAKYLEVKR
jgi:hypothetical protein